MSRTFIGFSHPKNPGIMTKIAMWLDKSKISHTFMAYEDVDWKCNMVIQVDEYGFRLIPLSKYMDGNVIVNLINMDKPEFGHFENGLAQVAREFAGTMYDFKGFFGMGLLLLFKRLFKNIKRRLKNPMASKRTLICSEAATLALQYGGCPGSESLIADSTSPQDLLNFINSVKIG